MDDANIGTQVSETIQQPEPGIEVSAPEHELDAPIPANSADYIKRLRAENMKLRQSRNTARDEKAQVAQERDAIKAEMEQIKSERLTKEQVDVQLLKVDLLSEAGLPLAARKYIQGNTEDEVKASIAEFKRLMPAPVQQQTVPPPQTPEPQTPTQQPTMPRRPEPVPAGQSVARTPTFGERVKTPRKELEQQTADLRKQIIDNWDN